MVGMRPGWNLDLKGWHSGLHRLIAIGSSITQVLNFEAILSGSKQIDIVGDCEVVFEIN